MTPMLDPGHIWNVIYNARSNKCPPPTSPNTAPATQNDSHAWSSSHMKRHLQCAEQQVSPSNLTKYCACHTEWLACLIVVTYETSFTMRGATGVTIQPHQILRLPHRMTRMLDRRHIWNVIYNARSNRCHHPTSPNTAPATQNESTALSFSHMKRHLQCAEQQVSLSNLTKFCACHEKWHCKISEKISKNRWNVISNAGTIREWSEHDPRMIREWSENEIANRNPPRKWGYFSSSPGAFSIVKYNVSSPILHSNIHQVLRLPTKSNTWPSPNTAPTTKSNTWTSPNTAPTTKSNTWTSPSTAPATKSDTCPSPSTAPTTKSDTHSSSSWHMKPHLQCAEQPMSPSKLTKYCACHAKWPLNIWQKFAENRWNVISNAGTIREWSENEIANRNPPRKWGYFSSSPGAFSIVKYNVSSPILHSNIHQVLRLPQKVTLDLHQILRKVTLELHQILPLPRKVAPELHQVLHLPRKVTLDLHQVLRLPQKVTRIVHPRDIWNLIYNARSNQCHPPNSPNTAPATQNDHLTSGRNLRKTGETSFPMRGRSEHDPRMIREWKRKPQPASKWGYFSSSPGAFSIVKYNVSSPILHSNIHQVLRLPQKVTLDLHQILRKVTLELHQILPLPRKVTLELHQVLHLPRKVTLDLHQVMHLPRKVTFELHLLYYSTLLDATLFDSTLLDSTLLDSTLLDSTLLDSTLLDTTLLDTTLLDLLYLTLLYLTLFYLTLFYLTLLYLTLLYLTLLNLTLLYLTYSTWL